VRLNINGLLDWILKVEDFSDDMNTLEEWKVKYVAYRLRVGASTWCKNVQNHNRIQGRPLIQTSDRMKQYLQARLMPKDFEQT